jgi:hypothetical protein
MRKFVTGLALAICALGAAPSAILGIGAAFAQQAGSPPGDAGLKQAPLTEAQIKQYLGAQKEVAAVFASLPPPPAAAGPPPPDPKILARLDAIAKKYHFASFDDFAIVEGNIQLVLEGVDPQTKKYVGAEVMLKQEIAEVQADKKMPPADKKAALAELSGELKAIVPVQVTANIDLVLKHFDELAAAEPPPPNK